MPRIRLAVWEMSRRIVPDPLGPVREVVHTRLMTRVFAALLVTRVVSKQNPTLRDDVNGLRQVVTGLGGGILEGRYLVVSPHADLNRRRAWLQDEKPIDQVLVESPFTFRLPPLP